MNNAINNLNIHKRKKGFDSSDTIPNRESGEETNYSPENKYKIKKKDKAKKTKLDKYNIISNRKRTNSLSADKGMEVENGQLSKTDASELMNRLEQFSNVWNDCPDVNNTTYSDHLYEINRRKRHKLVNNDVANGDKPLERDYSQSYVNDGKSSNEEYSLTKKTNNKQLNMKPFDSSKTELKARDSQHSLNIEKNSSELADLKRQKAAIEHRQLYVDQQKLIKKALSTLDGEKLNKKVVFSDDSDSERNEQRKTIIAQRDHDNILRTQLFEDNDDSEIETDLKLNPQFKGKKGQKLLQLQSKYASDSRFNLDTRFHDSGSETGENEILDIDQSDEKDKQLAILASIVNREIKPLSTIKKDISTQNEPRWMVRFDPTREDHSKYVLKPNEVRRDTDIVEKKKKTKSGKDVNSEQKDKKVENKTVVSDEKFYSVKDDLKKVLKTEKKEEFSLLKLFGPKEPKDSNIEPEGSQKLKKSKYKTKNPFQYDSSDSESEEEAHTISKKNEQLSAVSKPATSSTWRSTFFFTDHDSRLQEALEFLKAPEDQGDDKGFAEKRKMLKVFIKNKFKNNHRKNGLFQKKLGGLKRKPVSKNKLKKS